MLQIMIYKGDRPLAVQFIYGGVKKFPELHNSLTPKYLTNKCYNYYLRYQFNNGGVEFYQNTNTYGSFRKIIII